MFHVKQREIMRILLAYNPNSGSGAGKRVASELMSYLNAKGLSVNSFESKSREDLQESLQKMAKDYSLAFICGGDGTFRDAIEAIQNSGQPLPLGLIPAGSGNDFLRSIGKNFSLPDLVDYYLASDLLKVYACRCNEKVFINVFGVGIDTAILKRRMSFKKIKGVLSYFLSTLITLFSYQPRKYRITLDDMVLEDRYYIVTVCNGKYFGGGMQIAPSGDPESEYFQVVMMKKANLFKLIFAFTKIYKGKHTGLSYVDSFFSKSVKIELLSGEEYYNIDGDIYPESKMIDLRKTKDPSVLLKNPF